MAMAMAMVLMLGPRTTAAAATSQRKMRARLPALLPLLVALLVVPQQPSPCSAQMLQAAGGEGGAQVAVVERYPIEGTISLAELAVPASQVKVVLDQGERTAVPRSDGYFILQDILPGTHLLEVVAVGAVFPALRVDISARHQGRVRASYVDDQRRQLAAPLLIEPVKKDVDYFEQRAQFNLAALLKNPMVWMVGITLFMMLVLPKMMENMDPEELKRMQEHMNKNQGNPMAAMFTAPEAASAAAAASGSGSAPGGGRRS